MKPSDAFLGVIDFFSTLVPGAVVAFLLLNRNFVSLPSGWPPISWGSKEGWAVFLISAYLLGHAIFAVGSLLDKGYDRWYARWQRTSADWVKSTLPKAENGCLRRWHHGWTVYWTRAAHVWRKSTVPDDALLYSSKILKQLQLRDLLQGTGRHPLDISNTFSWAGTVVRVRSPAGTTEIESLQAQSKLFRSLVVILFATPFWYAFQLYSNRWSHSGMWFTFLAWFVFMALSVWRYCKLRWDATERTYEYFLALALPTNAAGETARLAYSYWVERAYQGGSAKEDWLGAERELKTVRQNPS